MRKSVGIEIKKLNNLMARNISKFSKDFPENRPTEMQISIVDYLIEADDGVMQKDLEQVFTIRKSTASRILKLMEKNGIIERQSVGYDARLKKIVLTEKARNRHLDMKVHAQEFEKRLRDGVDEDDLDTFFKVLRQMQDNLKG